MQDIEALRDISIPKRPKSRDDRAARLKALGSLTTLLNALKTLLLKTESVTKTRKAELDLPKNLTAVLAHLRKELKVRWQRPQTTRLCLLRLSTLLS